MPESPLGLPLQSPYLAILNKQAQIMRKAGAELGFLPASRTRVQVANERASPFAWLRDPRNDSDGLLKKPWDDDWWNRPPDEGRTGDAEVQADEELTKFVSVHATTKTASTAHPPNTAQLGSTCSNTPVAPLKPWPVPAQ